MITNNSVKSFLQMNIGSCIEMVKEAHYIYLRIFKCCVVPFIKKNIAVIESVQRRAARFVTSIQL